MQYAHTFHLVRRLCVTLKKLDHSLFSCLYLSNSCRVCCACLKPAVVPPVAHPTTAKGGESADDVVEKAAAMLKEVKALASNNTAEKPPAGCPLEISSLLLQAEVDICQARKPAVLTMLASSSHLLPSDHLLKYTPPNPMHP